MLAALPLWPLYWVGRLLWYRPPNVPRMVQIRRYLFLVWTEHPPPLGLSLLACLWLSLCILQKAALVPISGLAWLMDELLYGKSLNSLKIDVPFFVVSGGRSGSTQMVRYLEQDPDLIAPSILGCLFS